MLTGSILFSIAIVIACLLFVVFVFLWSSSKTITVDSKKTNNSDKVGAFYNETTDKFLEVYGEVIQAFRTKDVDSYLSYTLKNMGVKENMKLLDAGCGVAGPAVFFAKNMPKIQIDACSVSSVQIEKARLKISENKLSSNISATICDYHKMNEVFDLCSYDRVYFLESYGHSTDKETLLSAVWDVLKPGGKVYIKDLFEREVENEWEQAHIHKICEDINKAYEYQIGDLYNTLSLLRRKGFIINFIKTPEIKLDEFEHLSISNEFQNLFDIGKIESWEDYVFPVDFFEILAEKPIVKNEIDRHLYFLNKK